MPEVSQVSEFGKILLFLIVGGACLSITFFAGKMVSLRKPNPEKLTSYECGEEPVGNSRIQFNSRFYVIALIFLFFDVELAFIFPWTTIFGQHDLIQADPRWGWLSLIEMFIFVFVLILGLVYVWIKGDLEWIRPKPSTPKVSSAIPMSVYESINAGIYNVRPFQVQPVRSVPEEKESPIETTIIPKPAFKPMFRKPPPK